MSSLIVASCGSATPAAIEIRLEPPTTGGRAAVVVSGFDAPTLQQLTSNALTREQWTSILRVSVNDAQPAMAGDYAVRDRTLRFTPMFPLDPGRQYHVTFSGRAIPGGVSEAALQASVALPAVHVEATTTVTHVFPSADVVPENQLRMYIHFSAPMGRRGGLEFIKLLDESGREVIDPFLPLDAEFFNDDRTRYTVFFDPGRQKRGILPNQQMGRSLEPGKRYTLVVDREWRDGQGMPLKEEFRREFRVGPADERPIDHRAWRISAPLSSRDPIIVTFPEPLDHGLLLRALGVTAADGKFLEGEVKIDASETRWSFVPEEPWRPGTYQLTALGMLEDLAGNRVGRAFEVDQFDRADRSPEPERTTIPFTVTATTR